jgi:DNA-binding protein WhiA
MSFSYSVKKELCSLITDRDKKYACLYGMLLFCKQFSSESIVFQTENDMAAELFSNLTDDVLGHKNAVAKSERKNKNKATVYLLTVDSQKDRDELIYRYHILDNTDHRIHKDVIDNNNIYTFLAGAFLSCGSITEPIKEYHLEFVVSYSELAEDLLLLIQSLGITAKLTERKGASVIYLKESESIEDLLTVMGATVSSIELMNVKIYKDVRNKANRIANCDAANIERTLKASEKQIKDIEYIASTVGLDSLPKELENIAEIRLENPDCSLKELGEMLDKPLGRSGANHRLRKISAIADELRLKNRDKNYE